MDNIPTTPPSGFRDFLPDACAGRIHAIETISKVYRSFGFSQIATSAVDDLAVLTGKAGGANEKLIFKILKRGEKLQQSAGTGELADMGLRFDLTLPLARFYSKHKGQLPNPFKAFQVGPVWRAERAQKGRYREFYQCDVDIIGSDTVLCEIEVIQAITAGFKSLGMGQPTTLINDRTLLFALFDQAGIPADKRGEACVLLDKLDKVDRQTILADLEAAIGGPATKSLEKTALAAHPDMDLLSAVAPQAVARLLEIIKTLRELSGEPSAFALSPALVRGFDYYTGPIFEFRDPRFSGSLGGGGRYDHLTEKFGGQSVPACGGSIGFERLLLVLEQSGSAPRPAMLTSAPVSCSLRTSGSWVARASTRTLRATGSRR